MPCFVVFDVLVDILRYLLIRLMGRIIGFDDKSFRDFAGAIMRDLDDCTVGDVMVIEKMGFQLCRCDLVALWYISEAKRGMLLKDQP